jgi:hypothetical protein
MKSPPGRKSANKAMAITAIATLAGFALSYRLFLWGFIKYWERQHAGQKMKLTVWADQRAFPLALIVCLFVFYFTLKWLQRHKS